MVKYLTTSSYLTGAVCSSCARMLQNSRSPYTDSRKIGAIPRKLTCGRSVDKPALALAQTQRRGLPRLLAGVGRRVSPHKSAFSCAAWSGFACEDAEGTHENHGAGSAISGVFYIWNPPTLADSGHKKCSCRFRMSKIGASVFQIILYLQEFGFSFVFLDGMYHFARASLFPVRALPAFFFFIDYLFFFIIIYYTTCHRTAGRI